jgi:hypothetical protein
MCTTSARVTKLAVERRAALASSSFLRGRQERRVLRILKTDNANVTIAMTLVSLLFTYRETAVT